MRLFQRYHAATDHDLDRWSLISLINVRSCTPDMFTLRVDVSPQMYKIKNTVIFSYCARLEGCQHWPSSLSNHKKETQRQKRGKNNFLCLLGKLTWKLKLAFQGNSEKLLETFLLFSWEKCFTARNIYNARLDACADWAIGFDTSHQFTVRFTNLAFPN